MSERISFDTVDIMSILEEEEFESEFINKFLYKIEDNYIKLMSEEKRSGYSELEQRAIITKLADQYTYSDATPDKVMSSFSDVKHFEYFDAFLQQGESDKIISSLVENGIPLDVLLGIRKGQSYESGEDLEKKYGVKITQEVERDNDTGSLIISKFEITKDGEKIYSWDKRRIIEFPSNIGINPTLRLKEVIGKNGKKYKFVNGKFASKKQIEEYFN